MILSSDELAWIYFLMMPPLFPCPDRCKTCRHYATAIKVGKEDYVEGDFCRHFDSERAWDREKVSWLEKECEDYGLREKGVAYLGEVKPFVMEAYWV
jgi:hypothetical protein